MGPLGGDRFAGQDRFHRGRPPDRPRQAEQAASAGDQIALDLGQSERGPGARHHEIAGEHDLAPARRGEAVHGDDDRLAPLPVGEPGEPTPLGGDRQSVAAVDHLEVGAGAEHRPLLPLGVGGEDPDPEVVVVLEPVDGGFEAGRDCTVDGVARLGSIQRDHRHVRRQARGGERDGLTGRAGRGRVAHSAKVGISASSLASPSDVSASLVAMSVVTTSETMTGSEWATGSTTSMGATTASPSIAATDVSGSAAGVSGSAADVADPAGGVSGSGADSGSAADGSGSVADVSGATADSGSARGPSVAADGSDSAADSGSATDRGSAADVPGSAADSGSTADVSGSTADVSGSAVTGPSATAGGASPVAGGFGRPERRAGPG